MLGYVIMFNIVEEKSLFSRWVIFNIKASNEQVRDNCKDYLCDHQD